MRGTNAARAEGIELYRAGRYAEAVPHFDEVLARHGRDLEILVKRGACYLALDQPEKALDDFDRVNRSTAWASRVFGPAQSKISRARRGFRYSFRMSTSLKAGATAVSPC